MVEMVETAYILNNATSNSLIIMDEIGRGTSTYDGISIAWAVAEYLVRHFKPSPKVLFATHYHELQELEKVYPKKIKNYSLAVDEQNDQPIFLHTVTPQGASSSFGIAVGKLAGIPSEVIFKSYQILETMERRHVAPNHQDSIGSPVEQELQKLDVNALTPIEALNILANFKQRV